ncbi:hypothetical protein F5Y15DRAFT_420647 [Xylariaceae sp. FL0016]|nr:hypothetical protein F5Y15DRAFT_420647 [Xylariaceae sp. FL0016]
MKVITAQLLSAGIVLGAPGLQMRPGVPEGYGIVPLTWKGVLEKDGPEMAFNGTMEVKIPSALFPRLSAHESASDLQAQLINWSPSANHQTDPKHQTRILLGRPQIRARAARHTTAHQAQQIPGAAAPFPIPNSPLTPSPLTPAPPNQGNINCAVGDTDGQGYGPYQAIIEQRRDDLYDRPGNCEVGPGPRVCARVACANHAAVWLCNDNTSPITPACAYLGTYVQDLITICAVQDQIHHLPSVRGQEFDSDGYNVIVGWGDC